ncbi:hypothetical protein QUF74_08405 [Candidatus Halobeggiatoa sp. HSG11]|nr:hypothetical protein [Candidatus Halobeggiatoa sp. HSG11]
MLLLRISLCLAFGLSINTLIASETINGSNTIFFARQATRSDSWETG